MIEIRIDPDYVGMTLLEVLPMIEDDHAFITVRWNNTRDEIEALRNRRYEHITLVVSDQAAMVEAAQANGLRFCFDPVTAKRGESSLNDITVSNWRGFARALGSNPAASATAARGLLIEMANRNLRHGGRSLRFRAVLDGVLFAGVAPADMDVLLGLRARTR